MTEGQPNPADQRADPRPAGDRGPTEAGAEQRDFGRLRKAPRYGPFIGTGAGAGAVVALVVTLLTRSASRDEAQVVGGLAPDYSAVQVFLYLAFIFAAIGAAVGVVVALVLERRR